MIRPRNLSKKGVANWLLSGAVKVPHDRLDTPCLERPDLSRRASGKGATQIMFQGKLWTAYRLVFEGRNGPIGDGLNILHRCYNQFCLNPKHLYASRKINHDWRKEKGMAVGQPRKTREGDKTILSIQISKVELKRMKVRAAMLGKSMSAIGRVGMRRELRRLEEKENLD